MADNFNLAKFLRNNRLLNESIGGYRDIKLLREAYIKLGDTFKIKGEDYKVVATNDDNDLDPRDFVGQIEGFDPNDFVILYKLPFVGGSYGAWQENPSAEAVILSIEDGEDEFIIKKHSELSGGINEADDEQAYFDYKRSEEDDIDDVDPLPSLSPKFNISQDDFFGRMMDLAHEEFMGISDIVSMTIDSLRHGGFDDRDILNFLATDFSLDEGLAEAEMYTVDFGTNTQDFELDREAGVLKGLKPQRGLPGSPREEDIIPVMIDANGYLSTKDPRVKDISSASNANPFSDPGYKPGF